RCSGRGTRGPELFLNRGVLFYSAGGTFARDLLVVAGRRCSGWSSLNVSSVSAGTFTFLPLVSTCAPAPAAPPARAPMAAPLPPPAMAPITVPARAPPPTYLPVRLFTPRPSVPGTAVDGLETE